MKPFTVLLRGTKQSLNCALLVSISDLLLRIAHAEIVFLKCLGRLFRAMTTGQSILCCNFVECPAVLFKSANQLRINKLLSPY